jgi:hypothetical protein
MKLRHLLRKIFGMVLLRQHISEGRNGGAPDQRCADCMRHHGGYPMKFRMASIPYWVLIAWLVRCVFRRDWRGIEDGGCERISADDVCGFVHIR